MYGRKHNLNTREKMSQVQTGRRKKGKPWSEKTRQIQKIARTGKKRNDQFRQKRRLEALNDNRVRYLKGCHDKKIKDSTGITHSSLTKAAEYYNISPQAICDNLKGRSKKTRIGVTFEYTT